MYQALYRKYRPKTFSDVVGQDVVIKTLKNSLINNKISHAYIFCGPRGSGKTSIAKIFARLVNCQNTDGMNLCNSCVFCTQTDEQTMDIIEMDAASNNGVDEIREINNKVKLVPSVGKYKIYIIDEVHMLTIGAFNALLKTLEEPPAHVIFILATTDPHKVPVTILSRCQKFEFKKLSEDNIATKLLYICKNENITIDLEAIAEIARLGDGSLRDAISILDQVIAYTNDNITLQDVHDVNGTISQKNVHEFIMDVINSNLGKVINKISDYNNQGKSIIKITEEIIIFLRNVLLYKQDYADITNQLGTNEIIDTIQILNQSLLDMKKFSNPKIILELAIIKIMSKYMNKDVEYKIDKQKIKEEQKKDSIILENKTEIEKENNEAMNDATDDMKKIIEIRINNALANFSKRDTNDMKEKIIIVRDYLMDDQYNNCAEMILDGNLKAVGGEYIIFSYQTEHLANSFNDNIIDIESLLNKIFNYNYKVIAIDDESWNTIKEEFNSKKKKFVFKEETIKIDDVINKTEQDSMKTLFGEIVEYK